jgi:2-C-methyl-D-erythritol 2,4-cyclodiphosphate synthase
MRIGHGYDVHRFGEGDHIVLGGVRIAHDRGLIAHSDGDVLIHALCDALLGALALGDIGRHFPDTDAQNAGIDSRLLLRRVVALATKAGYSLANADLTIVAQAPRMAEHVQTMCEHLAADMGVACGQVNVKATTTEGLGFTGRGEGIAAYAVVLLCPQS